MFVSVGIENPAYQEDDTATILTKPSNGSAVRSSFDDAKNYNNGDLNFKSPTKHEDQHAEAVNLELINLKPNSKDVVGPYENGKGLSDIPVKKETELEIGSPYDEYFVPVNEHRKFMR